MLSLAARTREAVRARPFLHDALRAGVVNYTAAARLLDIEGDTEAIATALRRYAEELSGHADPVPDARVSMESSLGQVDDVGDSEPLLSVADTAYAPDAGSETAIVATDSVDAAAFERVLGVLRAESIDVAAAGLVDDSVVFVVDRRDGPDALRAVEGALDG